MLENTQSTPSEGQGMSTLSRIIGVFTAPKATFGDIVARPSWLVPFLIVAVITIVAGYVAQPLYLDAQKEAFLNNPKIPQEQAEKIIERMDSQMAGPMRYVNLGFGIVGLFIALAVVAGVVMFAGNVVLGGEAKFKQIFSVYTWSSLIGALAAIVKVPLMLSSNSIHVATSLSVLMPLDQKDTLLYKLLDKFDIFTFWQIAVFGIGVAVIYRYTTNKGITVVAVLWVIWAAITLALSSLFGGMIPGM